jgi:hypothetical protein
MRTRRLVTRRELPAGCAAALLREDLTGHSWLPVSTLEKGPDRVG